MSDNLKEEALRELYAFYVEFGANIFQEARDTPSEQLHAHVRSYTAFGHYLFSHVNFKDEDAPPRRFQCTQCGSRTDERKDTGMCERCFERQVDDLCLECNANHQVDRGLCRSCLDKEEAFIVLDEDERVPPAKRSTRLKRRKHDDMKRLYTSIHRALGDSGEVYQHLRTNDWFAQRYLVPIDQIIASVNPSNNTHARALANTIIHATLNGNTPVIRGRIARDKVVCCFCGILKICANILIVEGTSPLPIGSKCGDLASAIICFFMRIHQVAGEDNAPGSGVPVLLDEALEEIQVAHANK